MQCFRHRGGHLRRGPQSPQETATWERIRREPSGRSNSEVFRDGNNQGCLCNRRRPWRLGIEPWCDELPAPAGARFPKTLSAAVLAFDFYTPRASLEFCSRKLCIGQGPRGCLSNKCGQTNLSVENGFRIQP